MSTLMKNANIPAPFATQAQVTGAADILLDGESIAAIRPAGSDLSAEQTVDASGLFITPGLIDTHVHLLVENDLAKFLDWCITTVAELGTHPDSLVAQLKSVAEAPTILGAGTAASCVKI